MSILSDIAVLVKERKIFKAEDETGVCSLAYASFTITFILLLKIPFPV